MKKKISGGGSYKYIIPGILAIVLVVAIFLGTKFMPKQSLGSIYNIEEAGTNFDNIQIGDSINYEVNGYSDWQVIGKDDYEGTIDVVSKTNTEDLTLEPNQTKEYYENKFQEKANKYTDENYVINARTVNNKDLEYFVYDNEFLLNTINDTDIATSQGTFHYVVKNYKMYVIPYIEKYFENIEIYNIGDVIEYSNNGVDRWIVTEVKQAESLLVLIPETPIELVINSTDDNIRQKAEQIISSFNNDVSKYGNYVELFGVNSLPNLISSFLNQQTEKIWIYSYTCYSNYTSQGYIMEACGGTYSYYNSSFVKEYREIIYRSTDPKTLGYRPVLTLKVKQEIRDSDKKELSNELQVGDYVKYEAKGYKNWKVLSIDKDNNTVDIISGGIVKNLTLSGKEDWDNYEDIIQREVDEYKNGPNAKKATTITSSYLKTLKKIDKSLLSTYWTFSKSSHVDYTYTFDDGKVDFVYYNIGTIKLYKNDNFEMYLNNVTLYADFIGDEEAVNHYKRRFYGTNINGIYITDLNSISYTAGLRPIITLKLDSIEKLPEEETKRIEESTEKQEKVFIKEQESKNKDYKGPKTVDDSTSRTGNNEVKTNDNGNTKDNITDNNTSNVEKIVYKDKPSTRYQLIIQYIIIALQLGVIIYLLLKRKK